MNIIPIKFLVLSIIPEAIITILLGLYLLGFKPSIKRVAVAGVLQGICAYFILKNTGYGINFILQIVTLMILTHKVIIVAPLYSFIAILVGISISIVVEAANLIIFLKISQYTYPEIISREWLRIAYTMPKIAVLMLIAVICIRYKVTIVDELGFMAKPNR